MIEHIDRETILRDAIAATVDRGIAYGKPENSFDKIAGLWNAFLGDQLEYDLVPSDVALMMALMKIARLGQDYMSRDSWVDLAGYAACGAEVTFAPFETSGDDDGE